MKQPLLSAFVLLAFSSGFAQGLESFFPSAGYSGWSFGSSLDVQGNEIAVASRSIPFSANAGKVYLYDTGTETSQVFYPGEAAAADDFGTSIDLTANRLIIGAPGHAVSGIPGGGVFCYRKPGTMWEYESKLFAPDLASGDRFGHSVAVLGEYLFIGAPGYEADGSEIQDAGAVYVFTHEAGGWDYLQTLTLPDSHGFGSKVMAAGDRLVALEGSGEGYHAAATFTLVGGAWTLEAQTGPLVIIGDLISDIAYHDGKLFVLHPLQVDTAANHIDIMQTDGTVVSGFDVIQGDHQLSSMTFAGDRIFFGSRGYILQIERKFPLVVYKQNEEDWIPDGVLYGNGPAGEDDEFGRAVASDGTTVAVGAPDEQIADQGMAYHFNALGIDEPQRDVIMVHPNPTSSVVTIESASEIRTVRLFTTDGRLLQSGNMAPSRVDLTPYPAGLYLLECTDAQGNRTSRKIIRR